MGVQILFQNFDLGDLYVLFLGPLKIGPFVLFYVQALHSS